MVLIFWLSNFFMLSPTFLPRFLHHCHVVSQVTDLNTGRWKFSRFEHLPISFTALLRDVLSSLGFSMIPANCRRPDRGN